MRIFSKYAKNIEIWLFSGSKMHFNMLEFPSRKKKNCFTFVSAASYCCSIGLIFFFHLKRGVCEDPCDNFDPVYNLLEIIFNIRRKCCTRTFLSKDSKADWGCCLAFVMGGGGELCRTSRGQPRLDRRLLCIEMMTPHAPCLYLNSKYELLLPSYQEQ